MPSIAMEIPTILAAIVPPSVEKKNLLIPIKAKKLIILFWSFTIKKQSRNNCDDIDAH